MLGAAFAHNRPYTHYGRDLGSFISENEAMIYWKTLKIKQWLKLWVSLGECAPKEGKDGL